jgi:CO/xanthine dehydrogenase Mo-binding subunit
MMGLGYALQEEYRTDGNKIITDTLRKCKVPTINQAPEVTALIVEDAHSLGPFGAKGMAELPTAPTAPAISSAIYDALGVRLRDLPMTQERILAALRAAGK